MDTTDHLVAQRRIMYKNVILRLYADPHGDKATNLSMRKCAQYCPRRRTQAINDGDDDDCRGREQTPFDDTSSVCNEEYAFDDQPYIEFRFDTVRSHSQGFLFGTDPDCDFQVPDGLHLSSKHLCITFDDKRHLVVQDLGSRNGTAVSYSGMFPNNRRRKFTWIIGGINELHEQTVVIHMLRLSFRAFINYDIFADDGSASLIDEFRSQMTDEDIPANQ